MKVWQHPHTLLTINGGSTSIRFALFGAAEPLPLLLSGKLERIGLPGMQMIIDETGRPAQRAAPLAATDFHGAVRFLLKWLEDRGVCSSIRAAGHRVVHGMDHAGPTAVTPALLEELRRTSPYDPEHLPVEIDLMEAISLRYPQLPQTACFDTVFHRTMPRLATLLPIPRRYLEKGVRRYGFHGLSFACLLEELVRSGDPAASSGRVILAHLGGGASLAALRDGKCIDTSMGFSPASGLLMGTRSGDLDPGLGSFLARTEQMTPTQFQRMVNHESGLLGLSGTTSDMRDLLAAESSDERAAEAVALFCYQAKKWIGSFAAVLGGLDTLVFSGGIGENIPLVRERICQGLEFLGIDLDHALNGETASVISRPGSGTTVRVIRTNEEIMIARATFQSLTASARISA